MTDSGIPLRLALCITELEIGGAERCLVELATRIDRTRFHPVVYALSPRPAASERSLLPQLEIAGIETHFLGARSARHLPAAIRKLTRLLRKQRPLVLQSFLFHANFVSRLAARRARVPHVFSGVRVAERGVVWHLWLDHATRGLVERYVCVSQAVADFTRERIGLAPERMVVIPNGIDCERFASAKPIDLTTFGLPADRRAICYVGRLEVQKGVAELIEYSPLWLERLPDHELLIVGSGPLERELRALAARLNIESRVHFVGWRGDVPEILKASDLVVLPSRWEGMPNIILEAMASGRAIVSTDVEGVRELLGDGASEQLVPCGDFRAFGMRVGGLIADDSSRVRIGELNLIRAKDFSLSNMVKTYERLFLETARKTLRPEV